MSSVLARYDVSGERRKPKPSGSTSSVPSPKIDSPFFAWFLSMAKIRSCLRIRLAPSTPLRVAFSSSSETWRVLSSESCMVFRGTKGTAASMKCCVNGTRPELMKSGNTCCRFLLEEDALDPAPGPCRRAVVQSGAATAQRVGFLDIAVKEGGELGLGKRADLGRLDVAVLEQHQGRNAADAELGRRRLVLVDVDLGHLGAAAVLAGHVLQDRGDGLARAAPFGPVVHQHRDLGF